jgi:hypothetical protein
MSDDYYYSQAGQRCGPVPGEQLKQLAASGQLQPSDLIWKEGMPGWVAAAKVKGLFPAPPEPNRVAEHSTPAVAPSHPPEATNPERAGTADPPRAQARQAKEAAIAAGGHALAAFKVLIRNPAGGLREAFELLGPTHALGAGIVFAAAFVLFELLAVFVLIGSVPGFPVVSFLLKHIFFSLAFVAITAGGCAAVQAMFRGQHGIQADIFVAGASLLPVGAMVLIVSLLSHAFYVDLALDIIALTTTTIMLYSGCATLLKVPEAAATVVVPLIYLAGFVVWHLVFGSVTAGPLGL